MVQSISLYISVPTEVFTALLIDVFKHQFQQYCSQQQNWELSMDHFKDFKHMLTFQCFLKFQNVFPITL